MRWNKILLPLAFILHCIQIYGIFNPQLISCILVDLSHMEEVSERVYISPDISHEKKQHYLKIVEEAQSKTKDFWGENISRPVLILCSNEDDFEKFGDYNSEGISRLYTYGSYIIINPEGLTEDVISHELCHAELFERIGYENDVKIPAWFHEGLAMVVSGEFQNKHSNYSRVFEKYSENNLRADLESYESNTGFYSRSRRMELYYMKAGLEVSRWLKEKKKEGLDNFISKMNSGSSFEEAYK